MDSAPTYDVTHSRTIAWYVATAEKTLRRGKSSTTATPATKIPNTTTTTTTTTTDSCANLDPRGPGKLRFACAAVFFMGRVPLLVEIFHSFTTDSMNSAPTYDVTHSRTMARSFATAEKNGVYSFYSCYKCYKYYTYHD